MTTTYVKWPQPDPARSSGRVRVRVLDTSTGKLVTYPSGRVRWFGSEDAADQWIEAKTRTSARPFRPRNVRSLRT